MRSHIGPCWSGPLPCFGNNAQASNAQSWSALFDLDQCARTIWREKYLCGRGFDADVSRSMQTRHGSALSAIVQGWRRAIGVKAAELVKLARSYAGKVRRRRSDAVSSGPDACQALTRAPNDATLLACRMAALDLDSYELAITEAALIHHLQSRCMSCEAWRRCLQDLTRDRVSSAWRDRQGLDELLPKRVGAQDAERAAKPDQKRASVHISVSWLMVRAIANEKSERVGHASGPFAIF